MSRVLVLGCGPAGLAAAYAAVSSGSEAVIISKSTFPSKQYGCQYLHAPIPGYRSGVPKTRVNYRLIGTPEEYRAKVYGDKWNGKVSPEDFVGEHDAWDIRFTYSLMWNDLIASGKVPILVSNIDKSNITSLLEYAGEFGYNRIISTIPAPSICQKDHSFTGHSIWANGTTDFAAGENLVVCDGTDAHSWYRVSNVFGFSTTEWASKPEANAVPVLKPLSTDCDCFPHIIRVGRYGAWQKSALVHEVYPIVRMALHG